MPKEIVVESPRFITEDSESQGLVQVGWQPDPIGHVQIATLARHPETFETVIESAQFVTLDREGINDLIRYLRRARDQAFGRDE